MKKAQVSDDCFWSVPKLWLDETVTIVAGGPSLVPADVDYVRGKTRVIVINNSYQLAPWADLLYFCDLRWYEHFGHKDHPDFIAFEGIKVTLQNLHLPSNIKKLKNTGNQGLEENPIGLRTGSNSGYQCVNLAFHLGVSRIILLGYDMKFGPNNKTHWHAGHQDRKRRHTMVPSLSVYTKNMIPKFETIVKPLASHGIKVINCTPMSDLGCFPKKGLRQTI